MSNLTQKAMAQAAMDLLKTKSLDKITIKDITDRCGLTRNTFYYHFHDIYDLLTWLFTDKTDEIMDKYTEDENWEGGLEEVLRFLHDNKKMILNVYESISYDALFQFVNAIVYHHTEVIVTRKARDKEVSQAAIRLTADFYMNAIVGAVLAWVRQGLPQASEQLALICDELFTGTVSAALDSAERAVGRILGNG